MNGKRSQLTHNSEAYPHNNLNIEHVKVKLGGRTKLLTDYLRYKNEYKLINYEILDSALYCKRVIPEGNLACLEIAQDFISHRDIDPSKMILKLSQVIYKTSHKLVPQEIPNNKKQRQVDLLLSNKPLLRFKFECSNNKIAGRATAYEAISLLFPGVFSRLLLQLFDTVDEYDLVIFEAKSKPGNQLEDMRKRKGDIYFKLFKSEMKCKVSDRSGKLLGNTCNTQFAEQANFRERVKLKMFSTMANSILQKHAGRSLNFDVKLTNKISPENSLEGENKNEYAVNVVDNTAHKFLSASIICQNTKDAKNVCGLKFIELYANPIFAKIWSIEMPDEFPLPPPEPAQDTLSAEPTKLASSDAGTPLTAPQQYSLYGDLSKQAKRISNLTGVLSNYDSEEEDQHLEQHPEEDFEEDHNQHLEEDYQQEYYGGNHIVDKSLKTLWEEDLYDEADHDQYYYRPGDTPANGTAQVADLDPNLDDCQTDPKPDSDLSKSSSVENSEPEEALAREASEDHSEVAEKDTAEAWYTSVDKIFQHFLERKYNLKTVGDLSIFPPNLSSRPPKDFQGECLFSQDLPTRVNRALKAEGYRLEFFLVSRDEFTKEHEVRFVLQRNADQSASCQVVAFSHIKFSSNDLQHWQCVNYGIYLLLERCFPQLSAVLAAHWIRAKVSALYLDRPDCSCPDKERAAEASAAALDSQMNGSRPLLRDLSREDSASRKQAKRSQEHSTSLGASRTAKEPLDQLDLARLKAIEQFALSKREPNLPEDQLEEVKNWGLADASILADLRRQPFTQESWQFENLYINYEEFKQLKKTPGHYEAAIKKRDSFYSNIKKNMLEDDYSSVANSFVQTVFKTDVQIRNLDCYSVFRLAKKDVLVVKAHVQNSKLKTKLCSMVVLKLFWENLFVRCVQGDLAARKP